MVGDPIGDFIVRLVNAGAVRKATISVPYSKLKHAVADVLVKEGYVIAAEKQGKKVKKTLEVTLKYGADGVAHIRGVQRISKPGRRMYIKSTEMHKVKFGTGTLVVSTPKGVLSGSEARKEKVGGEQLFIIW